MLGCSDDALAETPIEVCSGGLPWLIIQMTSLKAVKNAAPDQSLIEKICNERNATGITLYCEGAETEGCSHHLRTFAPGVGIIEDPVCGTGSIAVAIHMAAHIHTHKDKFSFIAEQGLEVYRRGILHLSFERVENEPLRVTLGGQAVRTMQGTLEI